MINLLAKIKKFVCGVFEVLLWLFVPELLRIALKGKRCPRCNYPISKESTECSFENEPDKKYYMCRHCGQPIKRPKK